MPAWVLAVVLALGSGVAEPVLAAVPPDQVSVDLPVYELSDGLAVLEESWNYKLGWGAIPVGWATISGVDRSHGRAASQGVEVKASTNAFTDLLWRYRLSAEGELHVKPFGPSFFHIDESAKHRQKITRIDFDDQRHVRMFRRKGEEITEYEFDGANTYDVLSTTWLFLNLDYSIGQTYQADTLTGTSRYLVTVVAEANEEINVCGQQVATTRLRVKTVETTDPEEEQKHRETELWVSRERPRRLLKAKAKTRWGSITADMIEIKDLSTPAQLPLAEVAQAQPMRLCAGGGSYQTKRQRRPGVRRPLGPRRFLP